MSGKSFLVSTSGDRQVLTIPEANAEHGGIVECVAENEAGKCRCVSSLKIKGIWHIAYVYDYDYYYKFNLITQSKTPSKIFYLIISLNAPNEYVIVALGYKDYKLFLSQSYTKDVWVTVF